MSCIKYIGLEKGEFQLVLWAGTFSQFVCLGVHLARLGCLDPFSLGKWAFKVTCPARKCPCPDYIGRDLFGALGVYTQYLFGAFFRNRFFFLFDQNKFLRPTMRLKVMQQCFFVNWSVSLVPWKYETFPSIQVFFAELRRHFSPCPTRQEGIFFLSGVLVAVISTDNNEYISTYNIY